MQTEQKLDQMRRSLSESLERMQTGNQAQLDSIRKTVDEKLQETLDRKLNDSFQLVSQRLEQVYKGLGEMQTLAAGVGDLKKVLSNVKTRGVLGEIQLGAILEQLLTPDQYAVNVATKQGSQANVEYAIRLPGTNESPVWLPVDAKFPLDAYEQLLAAYDTADAAQVEVAVKTLKTRVKSFAKDVQTKYIDPPNTTDFAILFIPVEGLYAELVRAGMVEILQREYKVTLAGPTTMSALLNSLQMGFRTLAIQKRSSEVWKVLGAVKSEFDKFATVLEAAQNRLNQANSELDKLVGTRTRQIQRTLKNVETLPDESILAALPEEN
jgi:DNA recombination protein RmuC